MSSAGPIAQARVAGARLTTLWRATPAHVQSIGLVLIATLFITGMDSCAKAMATRYDPLLVVWFRYASQAVAVIVVFAPSLIGRLRTKRLGMQTARSLMLFLITICVFYGFRYMPQGDVVAVIQLAPLAMTGMAALLLGERVGPWRWAGVAIGFVGAMLVIRPGFSDWGWTAAFPLAAAFLFAGYNIATRFLNAVESPWTTFIYTGLVGLLAASVIAPFVWTTPAIEDLPVILGAGLLGGIGHAALIFAFMRASASTVAPYIYVGLIWAMLFGYVFFGESPDIWTIAGSAVIVGAGIFVQLGETRANTLARARAAAK